MMERWYQHTSGQQSHPSCTYLYKVLGDYVALYQREDPFPPGRTIPNCVTPFDIDDENPTKGEIKAVVRCLRSNSAGSHTQL